MTCADLCAPEVFLAVTVQEAHGTIIRQYQHVTGPESLLQLLANDSSAAVQFAVHDRVQQCGRLRTGTRAAFSFSNLFEYRIRRPPRRQPRSYLLSTCAA